MLATNRNTCSQFYRRKHGLTYFCNVKNMINAVPILLQFPLHSCSATDCKRILKNTAERMPKYRPPGIFINIQTSSSIRSDTVPKPFWVLDPLNPNPDPQLHLEVLRENTTGVPILHIP